MNDAEFIESVRKIVAQDRRYAPDAYVFVREALDFPSACSRNPPPQPGRHVSGQELLDGIRAFTLQEFGPMCGTSGWPAPGTIPVHRTTSTTTVP